MSDDQGLVFSFILDGKGGGTSADWKQIKQWKPEQGMLWLHLDYAEEKVQKWLSQESGINPVLWQ